MNDVSPLNGKYDWGIDGLVAQLRDLRVQSLETRSRRDKPPKLPSRKELNVIVDGLGAVLFPNRLGLPDLNDEGIDYFVGHTLETSAAHFIHKSAASFSLFPGIKVLMTQLMSKLLALPASLRRSCLP